jgi:SAM-dependent methyltransferase
MSEIPDACRRFNRLFHGGLSAAARSLVAVNVALRVLRPGGAFVFVDRFGDAKDHGDPAELARVLLATTQLRREPLVETLGVPWPLNSKRAPGPVEILSGQKAHGTT